MNVAFLSLGGNTGNRSVNLAQARHNIKTLCGDIIKTSSLYETEPWGHHSEKKYLNQVIKISTALNINELLATLHNIEYKNGRRRNGKQYDDRNIDIDILFFNNTVIQHHNIQVPHPRLHLRKFVLVPLNEIESTLVHPVLRKKIGTLLKNCPDNLNVWPYNPDIKNLYICIEGNIGSGKTTLAKALARKLNAAFVAEQFEQNHLLPLFYKAPDVYAFPLEYSFLISRFEQLKQAFTQHKGIIVSDFSIYKCLWFAVANLSKKEYGLFKKHFSAFNEHLRQPDILIHLTTSTENLKQNIKKRGRPFEKDIQGSYLKTISKEYTNGMQKLKHVTRLPVNILVYNSKLEKNFTKIILKFMKENYEEPV